MSAAAAIPDLSESLEDYLEAIYHLEQENHFARAAEIALRLSVSRPSVTGALKALRQRGFIHYDPYAHITLTPQGKRIAADVARRHKILKDFLVKVLAVPPAEAEHAACRMEHVLGAAVMTRFLDFARFVDTCPRAGAEWIRGFGFTCHDKGSYPECKPCMESAKGSCPIGSGSGKGPGG